jgi:hypothetical protein
MATPNAGRNIPFHFPAATFRNAIRFVFEMESPPEDAARIMFYFTDTVTFAGPADSDKVPFDPSQAPVRVTQAPIGVPCDIEFIASPDEPTAFGTVVAAKLKVLLLDEDYELVKNASFVVVNGDRYNKHYEPPSFGLFSVGLHEMVFVAEDEM